MNRRVRAVGNAAVSDDQRKQLAADLLDRLQQLAAPDADLEYSILRGKLDADEARTISEGLQVAVEALKGGQK